MCVYCVGGYSLLFLQVIPSLLEDQVLLCFLSLLGLLWVPLLPGVPVVQWLPVVRLDLLPQLVPVDQDLPCVLVDPIIIIISIINKDDHYTCT